MNTAYVGWEADTLQNNQVRAVYGPLPAMTLRGYQFDLGARPNTAPPFFGGSPIADILFQAAFIPSPNWNGGGGTIWPVAAQQTGGTNQANIGAEPAQDRVFCAAIVKMWVPQSVNKSLIMSDLSIIVSPGSYLGFYAGHSGYATDCELQAVLYYDEG